VLAAQRLDGTQRTTGQALHHPYGHPAAQHSPRRLDRSMHLVHGEQGVACSRHERSSPAARQFCRLAVEGLSPAVV
jgi:hypothetical protein